MIRPRKSAEEVKRDLRAPERGREAYADFDYLWHLGAIGVIDLQGNVRDGWRVDGTVWSKELSDTPARIALIDTGIADHPNLKRRVDWGLAVDFGTREAGATYPVPGRGGSAGGAAGSKVTTASYQSREEPVTLMAFANSRGVATTDPSDRLDLTTAQAELLASILSGRLAKQARRRDVSIQDQRYPSHGTAAAGMAVGTPVLVGNVFDVKKSWPYFGVDPLSEIVPIATSPEPEPEQLILALLYALSVEADVILMPRGADNRRAAARPDTSAAAAPSADKPVQTRYDHLDREWDLFDAVMIAVSKKIPIVCAAGNSGDGKIEYPASLAPDYPGPDRVIDEGIIVVGAVTPAGRRSGYGCYGQGMTLVAPSNDFRVYTRHQMRLDPQAPEAIDHNWLIHDFAALNGYADDKAYVEFCHEAPLAIDIPGSRGYRGGTRERPGGDAPDLDALYALFGGTSAAAAQVAGVVALMRRAHRHAGEQQAWSGPFVKAALLKSVKQDICGNKLEVDYSNEGDSDLDSQKKLWPMIFGAGLVWAPLAIDNARRAETDPA